MNDTLIWKDPRTGEFLVLERQEGSARLEELGRFASRAAAQRFLTTLENCGQI